MAELSNMTVTDELRWYKSEIDRGYRPIEYLQANSCVITKAADAIEKLTAENERLREAMKPNCAGCDSMHHDNGNCTAVGGFCTAVPAAHCPLIPKLRAENAQLRQQYIKAETDATNLTGQLVQAVDDLSKACFIPHGGCHLCKNRWTDVCKTCKRSDLWCDVCEDPVDNWEWRGVQEDKEDGKAD